MLRRPPTSPLFPTRRSSDLIGGARGRRLERRGGGRRERPPRSEEHTSELQSRENLVCRLLLEKKNIKTVPYRLAAMHWFCTMTHLLIAQRAQPTAPRLVLLS